MLKISRATSATKKEPTLELIRQTAFDECIIADARVKHYDVYDTPFIAPFATKVFSLSIIIKTCLF